MKSPSITLEEITSILNSKISKISSSAYQRNIRMVDIDLLVKAAIQLYNRLHFSAFNANVLIASDKAEVSQAYGAILASTLEECTSSNCCLIIDENHLYQLDHLQKQIKKLNSEILLVRNLKAEDPEKLSYVLSEFEKDDWSPAVILCATEEAIARIKNYTQQDSRLYHYLCGYKIFLPNFSEKDIVPLVIQRLQNEDHAVTESFRENLDIYIRAVYPEAQLTEMEFVDDLVNRIKQAHYQKIVTSSMLDETDVPYSRKAELLKQEDSNSTPQKDTIIPESTLLISEKQSTSPTETDIKKTSSSAKFTALPIKKVPELPVNKVNNDGLDEDDDINVLIFSLSTLPPAGADYCFVSQEQRSSIAECYMFHGESQLEPGSKYLISRLARLGKKLDKVLMLTSPETHNPSSRFDEKSAVQVYAKNIEKFLTGNVLDTPTEELCEAVIKKIKENPDISQAEIVSADKEIQNLYAPAAEQSDISNLEKSKTLPEIDRLRRYLDIEDILFDDQTLNQITGNILDGSDFAKKHINIFVDLQGGMRTFCYTLVASLTLLRDKNVTIRDMFATNYNRDSLINPLQIMNQEYAIINLVSGIRAFTQYGKSKELKVFLQNRKIEDDTPEKILIGILDEIDGNMQINNPSGFLAQFEYLRKNPELLQAETYNDAQFRLIVRDLKLTYALLLNEKSTILDQIKWFCQRSLTNTALTFIEDKIPRFLINLNGESNALIAIDYDSNEYSDADICKMCGGQTYYRKENNIFNFGLPNKIFTGLKQLFYLDLCRKWVEKPVSRILHSEKSAYPENLEIKGNFDKEYIKEKIKPILQKIDKNIFLEAETPLKDIVWPKCSVDECKTIINNCKPKPSKWSTDIFSKMKRTDLIGSSMRKEILDYFGGDSGKDMRNNLRVEMMIWYLTSSKTYSGLYPKISEGIKRKKELKFPIKALILEVSAYLLHAALFEKKEKITKYISRIFYESVTDSYELWTKIMNEYYPETFRNISTQLPVSNNICLSDSVITFEDTAEQDIQSLRTKDLIVLGETYISCRNEKNINGSNLWETYENVNFYLQYFADEYLAIAKKYLSLNNYDRCYDSIAAIPDFDCPPMLNINNAEWINHYYVTDGKRDQLDLITRLYKALKDERNVTNHASEDMESHIDYNTTRKAILVFVRLCRIAYEEPEE